MTLTRVHQYVVEESGRSLEALRHELNDQLYQNYSADYRFGGRGKIVVGSLFDYEKLLAALAEIPHVEFVTHRDMAAEPCPPDKLRIGFRHDIDAEIIGAEQQAEVERKHGVRATWYVLHTAPYYGRFENGRFLRNGCLAPIYRRLQTLGHEVALHTDPLWVYQQHGMDGAEAVTVEIEWLRSLGLDIRGTVAHNSKPVYGAWNYEIFKGRYDPKDDPAAAPDEVEHEGKWAPLRVLDEQALGLEYEGNEVLWQTHTPVEYGATRAVDRWRWVAHTRGTRGQPGELPFVDQARMIDDIRRLEPGRFVVLVVHPCYYGGRARRHQSPPRRMLDVRTKPGERLGWTAYDPGHMQCATDLWRGRQTFQTFNQPNELGMIDRPWPEAWEENALRVMVLGADNVDGLTVPIPEHCTSRAEELLRQPEDAQPAHVVKLAFPGMGVSRLWSWYERTREQVKPDVVILGIGGQTITQNVPALWSRPLGVSWRYPEGEYLDWNAETGAVDVVPASPTWRAHRMTSRSHLQLGCSTLDLPRAMAAPKANVEGIDGHTYVTECYRYVCAQLREHGVRPILLVEDLGDAIGMYHGAGGAERRKYQDAVLERILAIAEACDVSVINPYPAFDAQRLPFHDGDRRWNATGHRLAGEMVFETLRGETSKRRNAETPKSA